MRKQETEREITLSGEFELEITAIEILSNI